MRQFNTRPESMTPLFTALTIFGSTRDNSMQRLKVPGMRVSGGTVYCSSNTLLYMRLFRTRVHASVIIGGIFRNLMKQCFWIICKTLTKIREGRCNMWPVGVRGYTFTWPQASLCTPSDSPDSR